MLKLWSWRINVPLLHFSHLRLPIIRFRDSRLRDIALDLSWNSFVFLVFWNNSRIWYNGLSWSFCHHIIHLLRQLNQFLLQSSVSGLDYFFEVLSAAVFSSGFLAVERWAGCWCAFVVDISEIVPVFLVNWAIIFAFLLFYFSFLDSIDLVFLVLVPIKIILEDFLQVLLILLLQWVGFNRRNTMSTQYCVRKFLNIKFDLDHFFIAILFSQILHNDGFILFILILMFHFLCMKDQ